MHAFPSFLVSHNFTPTIPARWLHVDQVLASLLCLHPRISLLLTSIPFQPTRGHVVHRPSSSFTRTWSQATLTLLLHFTLQTLESGLMLQFVFSCPTLCAETCWRKLYDCIGHCHHIIMEFWFIWASSHPYTCSLISNELKVSPLQPPPPTFPL